MGVIVRVDLRGLVPWQDGQETLVRQSAQRAGIDALRAMRAEASRVIRARKNIKPSAVSKAITEVRPSSRHAFIWAVSASAAAMPMYAFEGTKQLGKAKRNKRTGRFRTGKQIDGGRGGVQVEINKGSPKLIRGAFIATMKSGHKGVFVRTGEYGRNGKSWAEKVKELFTTNVADAFTDAMPSVSARGQEVFVNAFKRNMKAGSEPARNITISGTNITYE